MQEYWKEVLYKMNGTEIITFLSTGIGNLSSAVGAVAGAIFTAIFLRSNTKTEEFEKIKAGQFQEVANELLAAGKMTYTEYYKAKNFLTIAKKADSYYQEHPRVEAKKAYDFDWFVRFFEAAGNISDDTMQNLWAKILAGEVAQPSTFSLKTIDVMRNLSKKDAELFIKMCSHSFIANTTNCFLPNEEEFIKTVGIQYEDIMKLSELGLMFNDGTISLNFDIGKEPVPLVRNKKLIMMISSTSGNTEKVWIGQYPLTEVGKELLTLINETASEEDFLKYAEVLSCNKSYKISVHNIIKSDGNLIEYKKTNLMGQEVQ